MELAHKMKILLFVHQWETKPISIASVTTTKESASTATLDTTLIWMLCALNFLRIARLLMCSEIVPVALLDSQLKMEHVYLRNATCLCVRNSTQTKHDAWNVQTALICRMDVARKWMETANSGSLKPESVSVATSDTS